jgi:hypothetical protein
MPQRRKKWGEPETFWQGYRRRSYHGFFMLDIKTDTSSTIRYSCIADWRFREFYPCRKFHLQMLFYVLLRSNFNIFVTVGKTHFCKPRYRPMGGSPRDENSVPNRNIWQKLLERYILVVDWQGVRRWSIRSIAIPVLLYFLKNVLSSRISINKPI